MNMSLASLFRFFLQSVIVSTLLFPMLLLAQDTSISGDLEVNYTPSDITSGNLSVDGEVKLAQLPADIDDVKPGYTSIYDIARAQYYGPFKIGEHRYAMEMVLTVHRPGGGATNSFVNLPLVSLVDSTNIVVSASIERGVVSGGDRLNNNNNGAIQGARWTLAGSVYNGIHALEHEAHGEGTRLSLSGFCWGGTKHLALSYDNPPNDTQVPTISIYIEASNFSLTGSSNTVLASSEPMQYGGTVFIPGGSIGLTSTHSHLNPVIIHESFTLGTPTDFTNLDDNYGKKTFGTENNLSEVLINGSLILSQPQGDISMGIFGQP